MVFPRADVTGGVERVALELLKYESSRRRTLFVGESVEIPGVQHAAPHVPRVPRSLGPWAFERAARRELEHLRPKTTVSLGVNCPPGDVLWVGSVHAAWLADGGEIYLRGVKIPPVVRRLLLRHQVLLRLERRYFTQSSPRLVLCTSQREADDLARYYGVARELLHVVPNGFDGEVFSAHRRADLRDEARSELGVEEGQQIVLMVANEWHRKGLGPLLRGLSLLGDDNVRLDLVGAKSPSEYLRQADALGLAGRVFWHGASAEVDRFYAAADVFALPTTYEPFGIVIIEAMAMGLPVVTSRLAGAAVAIDDGRDGLLLQDPRDPHEIARALRGALNADVSLGRRAAQAALPYEWSAILQGVDELIFS